MFKLKSIQLAVAILAGVVVTPVVYAQAVFGPYTSNTNMTNAMESISNGNGSYSSEINFGPMPSPSWGSGHGGAVLGPTANNTTEINYGPSPAPVPSWGSGHGGAVLGPTANNTTEINYGPSPAPTNNGGAVLGPTANNSEATWGPGSGNSIKESDVIFDEVAGTLTYPDGSVAHLTPDALYWQKLIRQPGWKGMPGFAENEVPNTTFTPGDNRGTTVSDGAVLGPTTPTNTNPVQNFPSGEGSITVSPGDNLYQNANLISLQELLARKNGVATSGNNTGTSSNNGGAVLGPTTPTNTGTGNSNGGAVLGPTNPAPFTPTPTPTYSDYTPTYSDNTPTWGPSYSGDLGPTANKPEASAVFDADAATLTYSDGSVAHLTPDAVYWHQLIRQPGFEYNFGF
jgi:hypothetical protein